METNFNFKSQICTSREQSERLLALGLKKETADCNYPISMLDGSPCDCIRVGNPSEQNYNAFPAWSLHRLIEIVCNGQTLKGDISSDIIFDEVIDCIEHEIKEKYFNKEYLGSSLG